MEQPAAFTVFYYGYVAKESGTVVKIDTGTNETVGSIAGFSSPKGLAVTPDGSKIYVTNSVGETTSVINTLTDTIADTIEVSESLNQVAMAPDGAKAYVSNSDVNSVSVITTATNLVTATIFFGFNPPTPYCLAVTPDSQKLFVTKSDNKVSIVNTVTGNVDTTLDVGTRPFGIVITPDGTKAYVANKNGNSVSVIDIINVTAQRLIKSAA